MASLSCPAGSRGQQVIDFAFYADFLQCSEEPIAVSSTSKSSIEGEFILLPSTSAPWGESSKSTRLQGADQRAPFSFTTRAVAISDLSGSSCHSTFA